MNKKFSTLVASLLFTSAFSVNAQVVDASYGKAHTSYAGAVGSETAYRTQNTQSDAFDFKAITGSIRAFNDYRVNEIKAEEWYQLEIGAASNAAEAKVLVQLRDYKTGELYLKAVPQKNLTSTTLFNGKNHTNNPSLNSSLWQINVSKTTEGSYIYEFVNKETGFTLSYNCAKATVLRAANEIDASNKLTIAAANDADINMSDVAQWRWYTAEKTDAQDGFGAMKLYTYNHNFEKVMGLAYDRTAPDRVVSVITDRAIATGTANGLTISDNLNLLSLTVRRAGARVLTADDINSMIDADGSWMNAADRAKRDSVFFKNAQGIENDLFVNGYKAYQNAANTDIKAGATTNAGKYEGYNIFFAKQYEDANGVFNKYLKVAEDARYENIPATDLHRGLKVSDELYSYWDGSQVVKVKPFYGDKRNDAHKRLTGATIDALSARYLWKVTYYPTQDSLSFEPLNASVIGTQDKADGKKWAETGLQSAAIGKYYNTVNAGVAAVHASATYNGVSKDPNIPVALTVMNMGSTAIDKDDVLTVGTTLGSYPANFKGAQYKDKYGKPVLTNYISEHGLKVEFDHEYTKMQRASLANGLYFIQLSVDKDKNSAYRKNGANLVMNLAGRLMYDNQDDYQNYNHMPATQWVIEQDTCEVGGEAPYVFITNREYGAEGKHAFYGQLYTAAENTYYFINHSKEYQPTNVQGKFDPYTNGNYYFSCGDTLVITPVTDKDALENAYVGYKKFDETALPYETWAIKNNKADIYGGLNTNKYLQINKEGLLVLEETPAQDFEFATGYTEMTSTGLVTVTEDKYGYVGKTTLPQLKRQAYVMKVRDKNLIDNNWNYLVVKDDANNNLYYQSAHLKTVDGKAVQLAAFYFKADQVTVDNEDAYVPVQLLDFVSMKPKNASAWLGFSPDNDFSKQDDYVSYQANALVHKPNPYDATIGYNGRAYFENGYMQMGIKDQTTKSTVVTLDTNPETVNDAVVFTPNTRPLYMPISQDVTNGEMNTTVNMVRPRGVNGGLEYFFEDGNNQSVAAPSALALPSFLGLTGDKIQPIGKETNTSFYVDSVVSSNPRMPQYLFFVENDSIKDGRWCKTGVHGYFPTEEQADAEDATHHIYYNGYNAGRVLVNLNDSIFQSNSDIDMTDVAAKFGFRNYTRLGFVEAIHMNVTADEAKVEDAAFHFINDGVAGEYLLVLKGGLKLKDLASKWNVIDPVLVEKAIEDELIDVNVLDGTHKNYAFSLRYTDDEHQNVLLESAGVDKVNGEYVPTGSIGTFKDASWMNVINGVPVLAQKYNFNGSHNEIGSNTSMSQLINQAQVINLTNGEEVATGNEEVAVSEVSVVAVNGSIIVKGAAGKTVAISNILGQTIVNTVIASDNETIAVPAGIVVVAVEGEEAVKAIVK